MNRSVALASLLFAGLSLAPFGNRVTADDQPFFGYSAESSRTERQWEEKLRAIPSPENLRAYMQRLSAHPHNVGSPYDKDNADWLAAKFKEFGFDVQIESYDVLFPTPKERQLELLDCKSASAADCSVKFSAKLEEPTLAVDPTSGQKSEQLPTYNAYSEAGDVVAPRVYVNYGIPEDYARLGRLGVSVKGAIAIARYGHSWRGIKPKVAAEHGAVGCIIYSDPEGDGYSPGETFPKGGFRPSDGVHGGSVADDPIYPGDPLTPGVAAKKDAKRLKVEDSPVITKIPVLPISYGDAQPLLAALTGPVAPNEWRGNLSLTYHVGPSTLKVHLKMKSNWDLKTINDVIRDVQDPETKLSVWKRAQLQTIASATSAEDRAEARNRADLRIGALGSGSDYGAFVQHDGIASLNIGYSGEDGGGIYHSIYDDFFWFTHFSDTEFVYGRALAQTSATAVIRLADADILPFEFTDFADTMQTYLKELKTLLQQKQDEIRERNKEIEEGVFQATNDPRHPTVAPKREEVAPFINFAPLDNVITELSKAAEAYKKAYDEAGARGGLATASASAQELNHLLMESERRLTNPEGLPGRPWFKHEIYAPGQYTGYEAKTIPGVREALELKRWKEAEEQVGIAAKTLQQEVALINEAAAKLSALH